MSGTDTLETQGSVDGLLEETERLVNNLEAADITEVSDASPESDSPDYRVDREVGAALKKNPYVMRRKVCHSTDCGCVTLRGDVDSYFAKQMAQESLRSIDGVKTISNKLRVIWS